MPQVTVTLTLGLDGLQAETRRVMEGRLRSVARHLGVEHQAFAWHELDPKCLSDIRDGLLQSGVAPGTVTGTWPRYGLAHLD